MEPLSGNSCELKTAKFDNNIGKNLDNNFDNKLDINIGNNLDNNLKLIMIPLSCSCTGKALTLVFYSDYYYCSTGTQLFAAVDYSATFRFSLPIFEAEKLYLL